MMGSILKLAASVMAAIFLLVGPGPDSRANEDVVEVKFEQLYKAVGAPKLEFTERVLGLKGKQVMMRGYMAPPLKANGQFFVLTKTPVSLCPFCDTDLDWPADIVVVYDVKGTYPTEARLKIAGKLDIGSMTDAETGFVSQLRLINAEVVR